MTRAVLAAAALALAGCPIPQPLPDYPPGTITPPRILLKTVKPSDPYILVPADCGYDSNKPTYELTAQLLDANTFEKVVARWFFNYDVNHPGTHDPRFGGDKTIIPNEDPLVLSRVVPTETFSPYDVAPPEDTGATDLVHPYTEPKTIRVVELVVSNNFSEPAQLSTPPYRAPAENFELQVQRWVFVLVSGTEGCGPHPVVLPQ